jgi:release factor glutamine methyltransferase
MTLRDNLQQGTTRLSAGPHAEKARRDAELLLLHHVGKDRAWLLSHFDDEFGGCRAIGYAALLERRKRGEPMQYILGETEFYGLPFRVTPDVLIPRPETEHLVEKAVQLIPLFDRRPRHLFEFHDVRSFKHREEQIKRTGDPRTAGWPPRILDVGTGSGAIAISIAHDWSEAEITATDFSQAALEVARSNAERLGFAEQVRFLQGDLLAPVAGEAFDLIVSNPPYVPTADRDSLAVEVREYEPALALFAGRDGLDIYRRLIPAAYAALSNGGCLVLEIGYGQADAIRDLLGAAEFRQIEFAYDLQGIPRVVTAQRT